MNKQETRVFVEPKIARMKQIIDLAGREGRELTAAESKEFDELDAAINTVTPINQFRRQAAQERLTDIESVLSKSTSRHMSANFNVRDVAGSEEWRDVETNKPIHIFGSGESLTEYRMREFGENKPEYGIGTICRALALGPKSELEKRALSEGTTSAGGYLVPTITSTMLIDAMRAKSAVFQAGARMLTLDTQVTNVARVATDPTAAWRNESAAFAESDTVFDQITFTARALGFYFKVSRELLQDAVNLDQAIQNVIAGAMAGALDQGCLNGNGTAPNIRGVANVTGVGSYSMGTNGLTLANYDPFIEVIKVLLDANVPLESIGAYVMATRTYAQAAKLKEATTNAPLAKPELIQGIPFIPTTRLPVNETQGSSSDCSRVITGDWSQMLVGARLPVTVQVLTERFAETGQVGYLAFARYDMQLAHAAAFAQIIGLKA